MHRKYVVNVNWIWRVIDNNTTILTAKIYENVMATLIFRLEDFDKRRRELFIRRCDNNDYARKEIFPSILEKEDYDLLYIFVTPFCKPYLTRLPTLF
jgi:hypothetical protein